MTGHISSSKFQLVKYACTCTYLIKKSHVKKVLPLLVSIKMWVSALLKEDTYLHFQGSTQARLDESTVNSFSQNVMRLRASKEDCCRPTNRYFVTKIVLTYCEEKIVPMNEKNF